ncbi:MAG: hypothetical protein CVV28_09310 [Methanobacteriales archaeon HGW-Methanobacteriales-1]|jgi:uncharacterized protein (DUF362 family)|nr:MAG: hypothetical protein CVV28_09310 [Methanobacteriales archaeon HGW-Methanobacteriales-1]
MNDNTVFVEGLSDSKANSISKSIKDVLLKSTNNLEWLSSGDIVLLKPALNSPDPYPSTTHPLSIKVISEILSENGAKVLIGDQSGLKDVLHDPYGVIHGETQDNYIKSGMGTIDDEFISFESEGWDDGFIHYQSNHTPSWPHGFHVTQWIEKVDHIINLPRLSSHSQAGATLGFKNMVGILRDDSRMDFHANGPFNNFIKNEAHGSSLKSIDDKSDTFIEKIVEISDSIKEKLRITLFVATQAQATFGPNRNALQIGKLEFGKAHIVNLKPGLIFTSADPVSAESFALALLKDIRKSIPFLHRLYPRLILFSNKNVINIDKIPVRDQKFIQHAQDISLGQMPDHIFYNNVPDGLKSRLKEYLDETHKS